MTETFVFKAVYLIFYATTIFIRYPYLKANRQNKIVASRKTTGEKILLGIATLGMALLPLVYIVTPWLDRFDYAVPLPGRIAGAVLLFFPVLWLFYRSHKDLGRNWSATLEIRDGHHIVSSGVYKHIRHPMYSSLWLGGWVLPLVLTNWVAGWSTLACFGILYFFRIDNEEKMMTSQFGEAYLAYKNRTKRLIPFVL
ncbi:MAG: protein-S-isoprenylcysteine O-methyltransferase [Cytophagales bacterium]|nr:protein-S-isoprenylcysteine O-methyltransferase [Cytophagales bacterium]